jgi:hypothetical protein
MEGAATGAELGAEVLREFRTALVPLLDGVEVPQLTSPNASELPSCS